MRVDVTFRNVKASSALRTYAEEKVSKLRKVMVKPIDAQVVLEQDGFRNIAELVVRDSGEVFAAKESSDDDLYAAIDRVADKLARQARRHKERVKDHRAPSVADLLAPMEERKSRERAADLDAELDALGD